MTLGSKAAREPWFSVTELYLVCNLLRPFRVRWKLWYRFLDGPLFGSNYNQEFFVLLWVETCNMVSHVCCVSKIFKFSLTIPCCVALVQVLFPSNFTKAKMLPYASFNAEGAGLILHSANFVARHRLFGCCTSKFRLSTFRQHYINSQHLEKWFLTFVNWLNQFFSPTPSCHLLRSIPWQVLLEVHSEKMEPHYCKLKKRIRWELELMKKYSYDKSCALTHTWACLRPKQIALHPWTDKIFPLNNVT